MMSVDDKTLMSYVDGELEAALAERLRARMSSDSTLRERSRIFEDTAGLLDEAFGPVLRDPMPEAVLDLLGSRSPGTTERPGPAPRSPKRQFAWLSFPSLAMAASLLLVVGVSGGYFASRVMREGAPSSGFSVAFSDASAGWQKGLDATPSGRAFSVTPVAGGTTQEIVPVATFLDHQDRYCRAFRQTASERPEGVRLRGIACRTAEGGWVTQVVVADSTRVAVTAQPSEPDRAYQPAASGANDAFERVLEAHMTTSPLSADQEARLMARAWR